MPINLPFRPRRDSYPADLWTKCPSCGEMLFNKQLDKAQRVCPHCGHHFRVSAKVRLALLLDSGTFRERDAGLAPVDRLGFVDQKPYPDRIAAAQLATGQRDAAIWGTGTIEGRPVAVCVMDFGFMGGSMGAVVGEKVARSAEAAAAERIPLIVVSASGGARMQEGTLALMQLVKTMAALERLRAARVPYISILTDPTTGGVFASFAAMGDVNIAEPNALIGFAGARVAAGTIAEELPPGFQRSEFLFRHGFVDRVVARSELRAEVTRVLDYLVPPQPAIEPTMAADNGTSLSLRRLPFIGALAGVGAGAGPGSPIGPGESTGNATGARPSNSGYGGTPADASGRGDASRDGDATGSEARLAGRSRGEPTDGAGARTSATSGEPIAVMAPDLEPPAGSVAAMLASVRRPSLTLPSISRPRPQVPGATALRARSGPAALADAPPDEPAGDAAADTGEEVIDG